MPYALSILGGFIAGVMVSALLEKRAIEEVQKLRVFMATELQRLAAKL